MRLPDINYAPPVQSLGRRDTGAPLRIGQATATAMTNLSTSTQKISQAQNEMALAEAKAALLEQMSVIGATINSKKTFTPDELDSLGVQYKSEIDQVDETGNIVSALREVIPSHEVAPEMYTKLTESVYSTGAGTLSSEKSKDELRLFYASIYKGGITEAIETSNKNKVGELAAKANQTFNDAVSAGNLYGAANIAEKALKNGLWTPEQYSDNTVELPSKVKASQYVIAFGLATGIAELERLRTEVIFDNVLTPDHRKVTLKDVDSQLSRIKTAEEKRIKEERSQRSQDTFTYEATDILGDGKPKPWDRLAGIMLHMENGDAKALLNINRAMENGGGVKSSDQSALRILTVQVKAMSIPVPGVTMAQKRGNVLDKLHEALGIDPVTNTPIPGAVPTLSIDDYVSLVDAVNKAQDFAISNPEIQVVSDHIWTTLAGAPKVGMGQYMDKPGPHAILASEAEYAMMRAAIGGGPNFDPHIWWANSKEKYLTQQGQRNIDKAHNMRLGDGSVVVDYMIIDPITGGLNKESTYENIKASIRSGAIDPADARIIVDTLFGEGS